MKPNKPTQEKCLRCGIPQNEHRGMPYCTELVPQPTVGEQTELPPMPEIQENDADYHLTMKALADLSEHQHEWEHSRTLIELRLRERQLCEALAEIHRLKPPTPIPVGEHPRADCEGCGDSKCPCNQIEPHKSEHWRNPETGQVECECCCGWALDTERLVRALRAIRDAQTIEAGNYALLSCAMRQIAKEALEASNVKN